MNDRRTSWISAFNRALFRLLLGSRLPVTSGALEIEGPRGPIALRRDRHGIPMIEAEDELDVFFGFGFCQGQDRTLQIELSKRAASGTLSELFGRRTLPVDRLFRRAGLRHAAEEQFQVLAPRVASIITAFASGVNAGSTVGLRRRQLPVEFVLLRARPTEFTALDVLTILKLQSFLMPSNWDCELARLMVLNLDGPDALLDLDPGYPEWHRVAVPPSGLASDVGKAAERLAEDLALFQETMLFPETTETGPGPNTGPNIEPDGGPTMEPNIGPGGGSNSWAVSGGRTRSGRPLLANDPHLAATAPPHWYLARLKARSSKSIKSKSKSPGWTVAGAALPGTPAIVVGHNGNCAWGVTAGLTDNTDLFLERVGTDGRSVLQDGEFVQCQVRREVIRVRGADPIEEEVLVTPRGPIISPALPSPEPGIVELGAVSMRAVWLDPLPVAGFLGALEASTVEEFCAPFADWSILPLGLVCADTQGNVGYQLVGQSPRRRRGCGIVPGAGWAPGAGWEEEGVPFGDMPRTLNPSCGYVAAANTQPEPPGSGPFLGIDWIDGYRLGRIAEALEERWDWDFDSTAALQLDVKSLPWEEMREFVLAGTPVSAETRAARELLETWDGRMASDSAGATLFHLFLAEMSGRVARARAPRSASWLLGRNLLPVSGSTSFAARQVGRVSRLIRERPPGWFGSSSSGDGWQAEIDDALRSAYSDAVRRLGEPTARWNWGRARTAMLRHPLGRIPLLGSILNLGPFQCPGDANTVFQAGTYGDDPLAGPGIVPSMRMVLDVGDWDRSLFSLPGGQSGNPLSPHYKDLLPAWLKGAGVAIAWTDEAVEAATVETLLLKPASKGPHT